MHHFHYVSVIESTNWTVIYVHAHVTNICLNFQITTINQIIKSSSNLILNHFSIHVMPPGLFVSHLRCAVGLYFWTHHQIMKPILINTSFPLTTCFGPIQAMWFEMWFLYSVHTSGIVTPRARLTRTLPSVLILHPDALSGRWKLCTVADTE